MVNNPTKQHRIVTVIQEGAASITLIALKVGVTIIGLMSKDKHAPYIIPTILIIL